MILTKETDRKTHCQTEIILNSYKIKNPTQDGASGETVSRLPGWDKSCITWPPKFITIKRLQYHEEKVVTCTNSASTCLVEQSECL